MDIEEYYEKRERWMRPRSLVSRRGEEQREIGKVGQVLEDEVRRLLRPGGMNYERETKREREKEKETVEHEGILQPAVFFFANGDGVASRYNRVPYRNTLTIYYVTVTVR